MPLLEVGQGCQTAFLTVHLLFQITPLVQVLEAHKPISNKVHHAVPVVTCVERAYAKTSILIDPPRQFMLATVAMSELEVPSSPHLKNA
jgi:hypothetical protein